MFDPEIFRSYDVRGIVPDQFEPTEAYHIGRAYAQHTGAKKVVVARDMRPSGDVIEPEVVRGLVDEGVDVIQIGQATSPLFYFAVHHLKAEGGINVTASHNPAEYNGMKMTRAEAVPIASDSGLLDIKELAEKRAWTDEAKKGSVTQVSVRKEYLDEVCEPGLAEGLTIVVDAGNGMAGLLLEEVFERIGGKVIPLYWELDGTFPNHEANPLEEENMRDLQAAVKRENADLGVAFDGDADRVFFTTEEGETIAGDIATALIGQERLKEQPGATILYDLRSSRATREGIEEAGGTATMSRVGHSFIKAMMREEGAIFAGEVSGHFYFTPWYAESGLLALSYMIRLLQERKEKLSEIVAPLMGRYATSPEINFEVDDKLGAMDRIEQHYRADGGEIH